VEVLVCRNSDETGLGWPGRTGTAVVGDTRGGGTLIGFIIHADLLF
jgi:hypothetical protein